MMASLATEWRRSWRRTSAEGRLAPACGRVLHHTSPSIEHNAEIADERRAGRLSTEHLWRTTRRLSEEHLHASALSTPQSRRLAREIAPRKESLSLIISVTCATLAGERGISIAVSDVSPRLLQNRGKLLGTPVEARRFSPHQELSHFRALTRRRRARRGFVWKCSVELRVQGLADKRSTIQDIVMSMIFLQYHFRTLGDSEFVAASCQLSAGAARSDGGPPRRGARVRGG